MVRIQVSIMVKQYVLQRLSSVRGFMHPVGCLKGVGGEKDSPR